MSKEYFTRRQDKLRAALSEKSVDGMLVTNMVHIRYLCGFTGSSGSLLVGPDTSEFITDGRYVVQSKNEVRNANITIDSIPHLEVINKKNFLSNGLTIGFDGNIISHQMFSNISKALSHVKWENIDLLFTSLPTGSSQLLLNNLTKYSKQSCLFSLPFI